MSHALISNGPTLQACMIWLLQYAQEEGDINALFYPLDYEGTACGVGSMVAYQ